MHARCILWIVLIMTISMPAAAAPPVFDIPRIDGIAVDGDGDDWAARGFRVDLVTAPDGGLRPADDFDLRFRVAWSRDGLLVLATVRDDVAVEGEDRSRLWRRDCVEIFVAEGAGGANRYQLVVASGADPEQEAVRQRLYDARPEEEGLGELSAQAASRVLADGYVVEALLPWTNLGLEPNPGSELGLQLVANDDDGSGDANGPLRVAWFPNLNPWDPGNKHRIRLAQEPGEAVRLRVDREITRGRCTVIVRGAGELVGAPVTVGDGGRLFAEEPLQLVDGRAGREIAIVMPAGAEKWPRQEVTVGGRRVADFEALPPLDPVVEGYVRAVGGPARIGKLTTRACKGKYRQDRVELYAEVPGRWVEILHTSEATLRMGFDGESGWRQDADDVERVAGLGRSLLAFLLDPQAPLRLHEYFPKMVLTAEQIQGERRLVVVRAIPAAGDARILRFDAETGLLARVDGWALEDYRTVDGIRFPFRITVASEQGTNRFVFDEVRHHLDLDDALFAMPRRGVVFADAFAGIDDPRVRPMLEELPYEHGGDNIPCRDGRLLYDLIVEHGYRRGLELGTSNGYSTLWLGLAFRKTGGRVITVEIDPERAGEARRNFVEAGLDGVIDSRINDALAEIRNLAGEFDFVFLDALKSDYIEYLRLLRGKISPGGAITAHNALSHEREMRDFLDAVRGDPDLETSIHRSSKEGISVSIRRK